MLSWKPSIAEIIEKKKENVKKVKYHKNIPFAVYYVEKECGYAIIQGKTRHILVCDNEKDFEEEIKIYKNT